MQIFLGFFYRDEHPVNRLTLPLCFRLWPLCRSDPAEEERPPSHSLSNSKLGLRGMEEEEEEVEGDDEEEEEGSLTEKSHDEAPESPSPVTTGVYEEDEEEEETAPLAMSYEHTRRYYLKTDITP